MKVRGGRRAKSTEEERQPAVSARPMHALRPDAPKFLVVCTANVSRSPLAAELFRSRFAARGLDIQVASAGITSVNLQVDDLAVKAGYEMGVNIASHQPRRITRAILQAEGADLVIGMTREHVREIVLLDERAWPRAFTLKELALRLQQNRLTIAQRSESWRQVIGCRRSMSDLVGECALDDIVDPYGRSMSTHLKVAEEMAIAVATIADELSRCVLAS